MTQKSFPIKLNLTPGQAQALLELLTGVIDNTPGTLYDNVSTYCHDIYHKSPVEMQTALEKIIPDNLLTQLDEFQQNATQP